jgi:hypothetical protein
VVDDVPNTPDDGEANMQTVIYKSFLVAPYIAVGEGFCKQKWSGTNQARDNKDFIGVFIDAFTHHSLVNSNFTAVLVNLIIYQSKH